MQVTIDSINVLLKYLETFEKDDFQPGIWEKNKNSLEPVFFNYNDIVNEFIYELYTEGFIIAFNWPKWEKEAEEYISKPELLQTADAKTLQKLLTFHVRKERFIEGHLAYTFQCGHIQNILRRLRNIRDRLQSAQ